MKTKMKFKKWLEMTGTGAIINNCRPTTDFQVWGACSERKKSGHHPKSKKRRP